MKTEDIKNKRVALLLSGGVDSAVVLHELVRQGVKPDCFYIKIGPSDDEGEWDCSMEEDLEMATALCHRYDVKLEVVDCHRDYWDEVTRYTMESVSAGRTPNPDVMCNRMIKFGAFDRKRGHEYDLIATGHYAQTEIDDEGLKWLCTSPDPVKDQTDFLAQLYDWQLKKALFPIGHMRKEEVRAIAEREHLVNAKRKDSQGICFLGKLNYNDYLRRYLGEKEGDIIDIETGKVLGKHKGIIHYTIGQRKHLGISVGAPIYVVGINAAENTVVLGDESHLFKTTAIVDDFNWIAGEAPAEPIRCKAKTRYRQKEQPATATVNADGTVTLVFDEPIRAITPGQAAVLYDGEIVLGGGVIVG